MPAKVTPTRIYPGTSQFDVSEARMSHRDYVRLAMWLTPVFLGIAALGYLLMLVWG